MPRSKPTLVRPSADGDNTTTAVFVPSTHTPAEQAIFFKCLNFIGPNSKINEFEIEQDDNGNRVLGLPKGYVAIYMGDEVKPADVSEIGTLNTLEFQRDEHIAAAQLCIGNNTASSNRLADHELPQHFGIASPQDILYGLKTIQYLKLQKRFCAGARPTREFDDINTFFGSPDAGQQLAIECNKIDAPKALVEHLNKLIFSYYLYILAAQSKQLVFIYGQYVITNAELSLPSLYFPKTLPRILTKHDIREIFGSNLEPQDPKQTLHDVLDKILSDANYELTKTVYGLNQWGEALNRWYNRLWYESKSAKANNNQLLGANNTSATQISDLIDPKDDTDPISPDLRSKARKELGAMMGLRTRQDSKLRPNASDTFRPSILSTNNNPLGSRDELRGLLSKNRDPRTQENTPCFHTISIQKEAARKTQNPQNKLQLHQARGNQNTYSMHTTLPSTVVNRYTADQNISSERSNKYVTVTTIVTKNHIDAATNKPITLQRMEQHYVTLDQDNNPEQQTTHCQPWYDTKGNRYDEDGILLDNTHPVFYFGHAIDITDLINPLLLEEAIDSLSPKADAPENNSKPVIVDCHNEPFSGDIEVDMPAQVQKVSDKPWTFLDYDIASKNCLLAHNELRIRIPLKLIADQLAAAAQLQAVNRRDGTKLKASSRILAKAIQLTKSHMNGSVSDSSSHSAGNVSSSIAPSTPTSARKQRAGFVANAARLVQKWTDPIIAKVDENMSEGPAKGVTNIMTEYVNSSRETFQNKHHVTSAQAILNRVSKENSPTTLTIRNIVYEELDKVTKQPETGGETSYNKTGTFVAICAKIIGILDNLPAQEKPGRTLQLKRSATINVSSLMRDIAAHIEIPGYEANTRHNNHDSSASSDFDTTSMQSSSATRNNTAGFSHPGGRG